MTSSTARRFWIGLASASVVGLASGSVAATSVPSDPASSGAPGADLEATPLDELASAASEEGALMVYSEMAPAALDAIAAAFEEAYPDIDVEFVRDTHPNLAPAVEIELNSGSGDGDVLITTNTSWFDEHSDTGAFLPLEGAELAGEGEFDPARYLKDDYIVSGGTINVFAWNTDDAPDGFASVSEMLDPEYEGRIGLPEPTAPVNVEWYTWLEEVAGVSLEDLAELDPRIYPGAVPLNEALVSGEISVTPYAFPTIAGPSQEAGAPVEFAVPEGLFWGAPYQAAALSSASHPAAAMLFMNYLVTPEGQAILNDQAAAVVPDVALGVVADMAPSYGITNEDLVEFQARFNEVLGR